MKDQNVTIILISGYARSGKDTLAKHLIGYSRTESARVSFATPLKRAVQLSLKELGLGHIDAFTEDPALKALLRPVFVEVGKAARAIDKDVFVKAAWKDICDLASGKELLVVPDLRYSNEIELFRKWGEGVGDTVKHIHIDRIGNLAANDEEYNSVRALPDADAYCIFEDGHTADIAKWADNYVSDLWAEGIFKNKKLAVAYDEKAPIFTSGNHEYAKPNKGTAKWTGTFNGPNGEPIFVDKTMPVFGHTHNPNPAPVEEQLKALWDESLALDETIDRVSQRVDYANDRMTKLRDAAIERTKRLKDKIRELEARLEKLEGNANA